MHRIHNFPVRKLNRKAPSKEKTAHLLPALFYSGKMMTRVTSALLSCQGRLHSLSCNIFWVFTAPLSIMSIFVGFLRKLYICNGGMRVLIAKNPQLGTIPVNKLLGNRLQYSRWRNIKTVDISIFNVTGRIRIGNLSRHVKLSWKSRLNNPVIGSVL